MQCKRGTAVAILALLAAACGGFGNYPPGSVAQGDPCNYDLDCAPLGGLSTVFCGCSSSRGSPVCHTYNTLPPLSQACNQVICPDTQICLFSTAHPTGECIDRAAEGTSCAWNECLPDLFCNPTNKLCERPRALGDACLVGHPESCLAPGVCDSKTARCTTPGAEGQSCATARCAAGLRCSSTSTTCVKPQPNGASCADDAGCLSDDCVSGQCETQLCF